MRNSSRKLQQQFFDYKITFMNSLHGHTNSKVYYVPKAAGFKAGFKNFKHK